MTWWNCTSLQGITDAACDGQTLYLFSDHDGERTCHHGVAQEVRITKREEDGSVSALSVRSHWPPKFGSWAETEGANP